MAVGAPSPADLLPSLACAGQVCAALANLAYADENKYEIAKGGAVTPLIVRAQSEDMEVARQACGCLANLAEMPDNQVCTPDPSPPPPPDPTHTDDTR